MLFKLKFMNLKNSLAWQEAAVARRGVLRSVEGLCRRTGFVYEPCILQLSAGLRKKVCV